MKRINSQGVAALEVILIVVALGLIGFTGYYVWHSKQATDSILKAPGDQYSAANAQTKRPVSTTECKLSDGSKGKWLSMKDSTFEFCEPNGWKLYYTEVPGAYLAGQQAITYQADVQPTTERVGGSDAVFEFYVYDNVDEKTEINGFIKKSSTTNTAGLKVDSYYHMTGKDDLVGAGIASLDEGTEQHKYIVTKGDKKLAFTYLHFMQTKDLTSLVEGVIASTK
jgi:hypothetical protein